MLLLIFGPPGSGKGEQGKKISAKYNFEHISIGEIFRNHVHEKTIIGEKVHNLISRGQLVGIDILEEVVKEQFEKYKNREGLVFDGFPRDNNQVDLLSKYAKMYNRTINSAIFLDVPAEVSIQRIQIRSKTSQRTDDLSLENIKKRLEVYKNETEPIYEKLKNKKICIHDINSNGTIEEIFTDIIFKLRIE